MKPHKIKFGPFVLDIGEGYLSNNSKRVSIRPKALDALIYLVQNEDRIVLREELGGALWPGVNVEEYQSLSVLINALREKLGDTAKEPLYIETVPKKGYRFIGGAKSKSPPPANPNKFSRALGFGFMALLLTGFFGFAYYSRDATRETLITANDLSANDRAKFISGVQQVKEGDFETGRRALLQVVSSQPDFGEGYFWVGRSFSWVPGVRLEQAIKAKPYYEKALALKFNPPEVSIELAYLKLIVDLDTNGAAELGQRILDKDPKNAKAQELLGWIQLAEGNPKGAIPYFDEVANLNPSQTNESGRQGWGYYMAGEPEEAARICRILIQAGFNTDSIRFCLMESYLAMGENDLAQSQAGELMKNAGLEEKQISEVLGENPTLWLTRYFLWRRNYLQSLDLDTAYGQAFVDLALGDEDAAFEKLKHEVGVRHFPYFLTFNSDPRLAGLKDRPDADQVFLTFSSMNSDH